MIVDYPKSSKKLQNLSICKTQLLLTVAVVLATGFVKLCMQSFLFCAFSIAFQNERLV